MALHFTREAWESIQLRLPDTGKMVQVELRFIRSMAKLVQVGELRAITQSAALKAMGASDTDYHRRQWRHAADYWQEHGVFVSATTQGYFIPSNEAERQRCVEFKHTTIEALQRRKNRLARMPLGKGFPDSLTNAS